MSAWRLSWATAQLTGLLFSSMVWLLVLAFSPASCAALVAVWALHGLLFTTDTGLRWRFGVRPLSESERSSVLAALVPIRSLRGRGQPTLWVGRWGMAGNHVAWGSRGDLIISARLLGWIVAGEIPAEKASVIVSHARGRVSDVMVGVVEAYCVPWSVVDKITAGFVGVASRTPIMWLAWKLRWVLFAVAVIDSWANQRWEAVAGVVVLALFSWSTGFFRRQWDRVLQRRGDDQVAADGLGPVLATMVRNSSTRGAARVVNRRGEAGA